MRRLPPVIFVLMVLVAPAAAQSPSAPRERAAAEARRLRPMIREVAMKLWRIAELPMREVDSSELIARAAEEEGFTVERGVAGIPTAFVASWSRGEGGKTIGVLAEYDALPGVGNAPAPTKKPREDGETAGHGCGHNLFAAGSLATALAVKRTMEADGIPGTVKLYGCPAEEQLVGKVYMARAGLFDGLDACLAWHPGTETRVSNVPSRALNTFEVEYTGQSAHGSSDPWNGRSAADAVELMNIGVQYMREHIRPTARIHSTIVEAGDQPNVVPDYAKIWYFCREKNRDLVEANYNWMLDIAAAAADMSRTEHKVTFITGVHSVFLNRPLQEAMQKNLERVGGPSFSQSQQRFAREMQKGLGIDPVGYRERIEPLAEGPAPLSGGSTDVAEVSRICPTVQVRVTSAAYGIPWHSWAATACNGREAAIQSPAIASQVLAMSAIEMMSDPDLLDRAAGFFEENLEAPYATPLPDRAQPPVPEELAAGAAPGR